MMISSRFDHHSFAETLRRRVLEGPGETDPALRQRVAARAADGPAIEAPRDDLARQIGEAAYRTTDAQVARVLAAAGSEKAAFELIAAAATGANHLRRYLGIRSPEAKMWHAKVSGCGGSVFEEPFLKALTPTSGLGKTLATIPMIPVGPVTTLNRSILLTERRMSGDGGDDFICGHCGHVMLEDFDPSTVRGNPVYQYGVCENNNDLPFAASDRRY